MNPTLPSFRLVFPNTRLPLIALLAIFATACAPADESGEEAMGDEMAMESDDAAATGGVEPMAQDAPVCQFTASGDELTGRASPPDSTTAPIGAATTKLCYGAPSMRDRDIMGALVPFGEPWRIGANEPTTIHLPIAAQIGTVPVEAGSYSLFSIPGESEWEIVVNSNIDRWGIPIDAAVRESDIGSFSVEPEALDAPVEQLAIRMEPAGDGADVVIEWETTRITFPVRPQ